MNPPRALWVPFELGRPIGAPDEPDFQRRVVEAALALFAAPDGPVFLDCKINADVAAPFMSEVAAFEAKQHA